ncbi:hypothetical protein JXD38_02440 [candidate division WOR-3 bacterium]|nr:hypothetical protein [candidate division WOR-3 bacterium]
MLPPTGRPTGRLPRSLRRSSARRIEAYDRGIIDWYIRPNNGANNCRNNDLYDFANNPRHGDADSFAHSSRHRSRYSS